MNTRLQVEHPVTEMICGFDLVRTQIEIAAGGGLPLTQSQARVDGHAIECRICAEDPDAGFLPATGPVRLLRAPTGEHIRFENALEQGQRVTADFDPMLAKLVVWGKDRAEATDRMAAALKQLTILGVRTNIDYLIRVLETAAFRDGALHTGFVVEHGDALAPVPVDDGLRDKILIAAALGQRTFRDAIADVGEPHASMAGWN
jgi:acetyl/propionyl-CoA carboxylase alpha subunit